MLTPGFMFATVVKDIRNRLGTFVEADANNFNGLWRDYMRVRVMINVDHPLKQKLNLKGQGDQACCVQFKYEGLTTFCFVCGRLGHSERFCDKIFDTPLHLIEKPYGPGMKAPSRGRTHSMGAKWLCQNVTYKGDAGADTAPPPLVSVVPVSAKSPEVSIDSSLIERIDRGIMFEELRRQPPTNSVVQAGLSYPTNSGVQIGPIIAHSASSDMEKHSHANLANLLVIPEGKHKRVDLSGLASSGPHGDQLSSSTTLGLLSSPHEKSQNLMVIDEAQPCYTLAEVRDGSKNEIGAGPGSQARRGL